MHDTLFYGGPILTQDDDNSLPEAVLVRGERLEFVGPLADAERLAGGAAERVDLAGRCLLPGFHDAHVHLTQHGLDLSRLNLLGTGTLEEALDLVAARAGEQAPGTWLEGSGLSMSRWNVATGTQRKGGSVVPKC